MKDKPSALLMLALSACGPAKLAPTSASSTSASSTSAETSDATTDEGPAETEGTSEATSEDTSQTFVLGDHTTEPGLCDPFSQDCPDGEKCVPYASSGGTWDSNKCVPVTGDRAPGEPCVYDGARAGTDDCDATSMCWDGECVPFCMGSPEQPECPEGTFCPLSGDGVLNLCIATCDPVAQDCDDDQGCYWTGNAFLCVPQLQNIPLGEACGFINDCAPGLLCASTDALPSCAGLACCAAYCDLQLGDGPCQAVPGTSCVPFFEEGEAPPEYEHVGVCVVP